MKEFWPGTRIKTFDSRLYKDDISTPLDVTIKSGTVIKWYGYVSEWMEKEFGREVAKYPELIDIKFDHSEKISHGHFIDFVEIL